VTNQEIFDKVVRHLAAQGGKSMLGPRCRYRADGGKKCAIGCLIPDDYYEPEMEGLSVAMRRVRRGLKDLLELDGDNDERLDILRSLQLCHDNARVNADDEWTDVYSPGYGVAWDLRVIAETFGLSQTAISEVFP
jgi:hypothetical protein